MTREALTVNVARGIGEKYEQDIVVLMCHAEKTGEISLITWGREIRHKENAARTGDWIQNELGFPAASVDVKEDFRRQGEAAMEVDRLKRQLRAIRQALDEIVISKGEDAGVVLLSPESRQTWNADRQCHQYEHDYFSPLGYALVALAKLASEEGESGEPTGS